MGYLDMRHFLHMIGPDNRAFLRRVHLILDDAPRQYALQLPDEGRFIYDANLLACLKLMSRDVYLKKLSLTFYGRRYLSRLDVRFLEALCAVQVDELVINPENQWGGAKYDQKILDLLKNEMVRDDPLYDTEKLDKNRRFNPGVVHWGAT